MKNQEYQKRLGKIKMKEEIKRNLGIKEKFRELRNLQNQLSTLTMEEIEK